MTTSRCPSDSLRKKLVVAGVPESEHSAESLGAMMPDLHTRSLKDLSADMMAELLLYFVAKGIVTFPVASEKALLDLPWGSHVCQFYNDQDELTRMLVPYFKQGLERNEACVWLVADLTVEQAQSALAAAVPDLDRFIATGLTAPAAPRSPSADQLHPRRAADADSAARRGNPPVSS